MLYYIIKLLISSALIVLISEISKRSSVTGAFFASLPLVSILAIIWMYIETKDIEAIRQLSISIFWLVIPSLALFVLLPLFLHYQIRFYLSLILSIVCTVILYLVLIYILHFFKIKI